MTRLVLLGVEGLRSHYTKYCEIKKTWTLKGEVHQLVRFQIPVPSRSLRKRIIDKAFEESGADIMIEIVRSSGGIIQKEMMRFEAVLIFERRPMVQRE